MLSGSRQPAPATGVLYLHGFNSGAASPKGVLMRRACEAVGVPCITPQLPHQPSEALALAESHLSELGERPMVAGSSMGGFLATCLAERFALAGVLINPAVRPADLVAEWVGERFVNDHTGERFTIGERHLVELAALTPEAVSPERYLLLLGTADEVLDPAHACALYRGASMLLHPGADHAFMVLARHLPAVLAHGGHALPPKWQASQH
ncbi:MULTISPECIES: YqiA/YcfP family alpha/beta fold hydrolase [Halomonas]|uniref:Esterase n=2 Tax=Halomonas TaxID=2745 RepID=A0A7X4VYZ8_9GAMM|nr:MULTISPECIES: YqiA/YcfP family alpha/beta fold hydrolase [Halomonas]MDR5902354.1 YqiA/YcfP family alpha/beta fold hydrolase [Halomonas icarae]NAW12821.1 esterase [Halomonas icarae]TDA95789.1 esterase [Halomonas marinisediminis]